MVSVRVLSHELQEMAAKECEEVNENIPGAIAELREWVNRHNTLKGRVDDQFLIAFLRHCKYNLEEAKERYYYYYEYKSTSGLLGSTKIDSKLLEICDSGVFATLTKPCGPAGCRIHVTRMGRIDTNKFNVKDLFRYHMFRSEMEIVLDDHWTIAGVIEIIDFHKMPYAILRQFEPSLFRKMAAFLEYGLPTNLRATHVVNASLDVQMILGIVKTLMREKELLQIHTSLDSLQKAIGIEFLPDDYGGTGGTLCEAVSVFKAKLVAMERHFDDNEQFGVQETSPKRSRKVEISNNDSTSGTVGTFRKLEVD